MSRPSLLAHRDFRLLLLGQTTSQLGAQVSGVAIPLLAVLGLDASPLELGVVTGSGTVAFALVGLPAGAWLDRSRRRWILVTSDLSRAVLLATIPLAAAFGVLTIGQLVAVSLLSGFGRVFFDIGYQSYLPCVIGSEHVLSGNSALQSVRSGGQIAGPGIGGWLVTAIGAANVVLVQAASFVVSAVALLAVGTREPRAIAVPNRPSLRADVLAGLAFVWRNQVLRATAITSAGNNLGFAIASAVAFIFMSRRLDLSPAAIGLIVGAGSLTVLIGAAVTPALSRRVGPVRLIWVSLAVTGPLTALGPLAQPGPLVVLLVLGSAVGELGQIVYAITNVSLRQRYCPEGMLGRVNATMQVLIMGLFPLGALLGGVLGEVIGVRGTLWASVGVAVVSTLPLFRVLRGARSYVDLPAWDQDPQAP